MVTKVGIARGITAAWLLLKYRKEMEENYAKGDWLEAGQDTAWLAVTLTPVVAPNFFFGTVAFPVLTGAAIGVGATMVIVEATGIGTAEEVLDLVLDPPSAKQWFEVVGPAIQSEITEPALAYVYGLWEQGKKDVARWREDIQTSSSDWVDEFVNAEPLSISASWKQFWSIRQFTL